MTAWKEVFVMATSTAKKINPDDYILAVLSPEDRLDAAFKVTAETFKKTKLTIREIDNTVKSARRRKAYEKKRY